MRSSGKRTDDQFPPELRKLVPAYDLFRRTTVIMPYKAILFDLDGTLLDTLADLADSTNAALAAMGLPQHPVQAYKLFVGDGIESLVRRAMGPQADDAALARGIELSRQEYARRWADKSRPYPGIPELLDGLTAPGFRWPSSRTSPTSSRGCA